jgi:hypothetical protein
MPTASSALEGATFVISAEIRAAKRGNRWRPIARWRSPESIDAALERAALIFRQLPMERPMESGPWFPTMVNLDRSAWESHGRVSVDDTEYAWNVRHLAPWTADSLYVFVPDGKGRDLVLDFPLGELGTVEGTQDLSAIVTALRQCIPLALRSGWDPARRGKPVRFDVSALRRRNLGLVDRSNTEALLGTAHPASGEKSKRKRKLTKKREGY